MSDKIACVNLPHGYDRPVSHYFHKYCLHVTAKRIPEKAMKFFQVKGSRFVSLGDSGLRESLLLCPMGLNRVRDEDRMVSRTARFLAHMSSMGRVGGMVSSWGLWTAADWQ